MRPSDTARPIARTFHDLNAGMSWRGLTCPGIADCLVGPSPSQCLEADASYFIVGGNR